MRFRQACEARRKRMPRYSIRWGQTLNKMGRPDEEILAYRRAIAIKAGSRQFYREARSGIVWPASLSLTLPLPSTS